jgi:hypothetical protein
LAEKVIDYISKNGSELAEWPANLMIHIFEKLAQLNEKEND